VFDKKADELFSLPVELVREEISRQLTVAGEHVPVLKSLLSYKGTKHANLTPESLVEFLTKGKHICSLLGIKAIMPKSLLQIARPRIALAAKPKNGKEKTISYLNLNDMLDFSWQVSIGDKNISAEEFRSLTESASGIIKFHDQYLLVETDSLKSILNALKDPVPRLSAMQTLQAAVTGEVSGIVFDPDLMLKQMIDALSAAKDIPLPGNLCAQLRPYQQRGFVWLYNNTLKGLGSCLADDMGLGKTIQVLTLLLKLKEEKWSKKPALVVCPTTLIGNWQKECEKFAPTLDVAIYHGANRELNEQVDLIITSYGMLRRDLDLLKKIKWSVVIIDEAQNIKNTDTDQTKAVKSLSAKGYIALSGTPVENRLMELWSIFDFINKDYLGKQKEFAQRFAYPIEKYKDEEKITKLLKATAPFMLRRLKSDRTIIKDLPPKIIKEQHCLLSKEQAALYQQTLQNLMREIEGNEGIARKGLIFKLMTSLKQICNHPVQFTKKGTLEKGHSGKAARAIDLLDEAASRGEKTLVFTQYKEMGDLLESLIWDELQTEPLFFHGGLPRIQRDDMVLKFQQDEAFPIMIVSLKAGGTGLNLTSATNVIHYDLWWNPAVEDQATDRAYRIGQNSTVIVNRLLSLGTFEEKINEMMSAKRELAALTVAAGENGLSELSNQDLKELFSLNTSSYMSAD
jgi:SNF2 family DNA or RNA helicase